MWQHPQVALAECNVDFILLQSLNSEGGKNEDESGG